MTSLVDIVLGVCLVSPGRRGGAALRREKRRKNVKRAFFSPTSSRPQK